MKIKDLATGQIFEYGTNCHHALRISEDGMTLSFENLQNGDGSKYGDYRFVDDNEEKTPDEIESEYASECYFNIGGFDTSTEHINTSTNNDFCEWKYTNSTSYTATISCEKKTMNIKSMRYYTYCPYCGKKIKVVE